MAVGNLVGVLVILPFLAGLGALGIKEERVRKPVVVVAVLALMAASVLLLQRVIAGGPLVLSPAPAWDTIVLLLDLALLAYFLYLGYQTRHPLVLVFAGLQAVMLPLLKFLWLPSGFTVTPVLYIDLLSVVMTLVICLVGGLIVIYALDYMREHERHLELAETRQPVFFLFLIAFLGAMNGLVFANSLLWLFFFWEMTTLCCFHLIRHDLTKEAVQNALCALWMNLLGGAALVVGMALLWRAHQTLSIQELSGIATVGPALLLPLALFCLTGFTKAAQVPFQGWLLGAMVAPTPVSALLHASTMVKAGVYLVLRLAPVYAETMLSVAVALFGAFVFMMTSVIAISQTNAKRVLAYSTVSNLGLIVCCAGLNTALAIAAAIALIIFHAISKGVLFMVVGFIEQRIESRDIEDMEGLAARLPLLSATAVFGMVTMLFVPFGVLFAKWAGIQAAALPLSIWFPLIVAFLAVGSATTMVYWIKWIGRMICLVSPEKEPGAEQKTFCGYGAILLLGAAAVVLSVFLAPLFNLLITPAETAMGYAAALQTTGWHIRTAQGLFTPWPLFIAVGAAVLLPVLLVRVKKEQCRPAYMCGANAETEVPSFYTAAGEVAAAQTGGAYWACIFGETSLSRWVNGAGLILLAALFVGVFL